MELLNCPYGTLNDSVFGTSCSLAELSMKHPDKVVLHLEDVDIDGAVYHVVMIGESDDVAKYFETRNSQKK